MNPTRAVATAHAFVAVAGALLPIRSATAALDMKQMTPAACQPFGPGTTASELTYNQLGITNPGISNETVICPFTTDSEFSWTSGSTINSYLFVFYRAGGISGKVACTVFVNSTTVSSGAVYTVSANPNPVAANARGSIQLDLKDTSGKFSIGPPLAAVCTITPKAILGSFTLREQFVTNTP
jgi:hypothetical protein